MKRDLSVTLSLVAMLAVYGFATATGHTEGSFGESPPWWFHLIFWPMLLAGLRAAILWFQTLIDAARPKDRKAARYVWLIAHFVFGPFASYLYYYAVKPGGPETLARREAALKRRANDGTL
ncbi:MAG: hypothetical protein NTV51_03430 [Verrucomicrobia bacterium]|nr:hypothetical protein [Verrucomicrobiota bacterium]